MGIMPHLSEAPHSGQQPVECGLASLNSQQLLLGYLRTTTARACSGRQQGKGNEGKGVVFREVGFDCSQERKVGGGGGGWNFSWYDN